MKGLIIILFIANFTQAQVVMINEGFSRFAGNVGGKDEFMRIFKQEIVYPENPLKENIKGKVIVGLKVTKEGKAENVSVLQSLHQELDNEALRFIKLLEWKPAIYREELTDTYIKVPIRFSPAAYKKNVAKRGYDATILPANTDTSLLVYDKPDKSAAFFDGNDMFASFINDNLVYPKNALENNLSGEVKVGFIIEPTGRITNLRIEKSVGAGCDEEALRVIRMTRWKPATHKGKIVRSRMIIPVNFQLQGNVRENGNYEQRTP